MKISRKYKHIIILNIKLGELRAYRKHYRKPKFGTNNLQSLQGQF